MTDLTEKWKAGELNDGFYYTQTGKDRIIAIDMYDKESNTWLLNSDKDMPPFEVLAPVPSYNEVQSLEADRLAKNEGEEIVAELKDKYDVLMLNIRMLIQEKNLLKKHIGELGAENAIIRVLLKEVKGVAV